METIRKAKVTCNTCEETFEGEVKMLKLKGGGLFLDTTESIVGDLLVSLVKHHKLTRPKISRREGLAAGHLHYELEAGDAGGSVTVSGDRAILSENLE